jgi:hypothetical protein
MGQRRVVSNEPKVILFPFSSIVSNIIFEVKIWSKVAILNFPHNPFSGMCMMRYAVCTVEFHQRQIVCSRSMIVVWVRIRFTQNYTASYTTINSRLPGLIHGFLCHSADNGLSRRHAVSAFYAPYFPLATSFK